MATMVIERIKEIKQMKRINKDKAVEMFFALVREHPFPVNTIVLHYAFHMEEVAAIVFYKKWGGKFFPGIEEAAVEIWSEGRMLKEYQEKGFSDLDLLLTKKTLIIGTANSLTDEHGTKFPSAAHLAVELLGLAGNPLFRKLLNFYESTDNRPNATFFDFHSFAKRAHVFNKYISKGDEEVENVAIKSLLDQMIYTVEVDLWDQMRFFECEDEFIKKGKTFRWVNLAHPKDTIEIVTIETDNHAMARFVRSVWNESNRNAKKQNSAVPDIYIQQGSNKSTVVFFSPRLLRKLKLSGVDIRDFVRVLRIVELKKSGLIYDSLSERWLALDEKGRIKFFLSWQDLEVSLDCECSPSWYHSTKGDQLLSRSLTALDAPETRLSIRQIAGAIALALTPLIRPCGAAKQSDGKDCRACYFYKLGFISCRQKRFKAFKDGNLVSAGSVL